MKLLKKLFRRWFCEYKGCSGITGSNEECTNCPVYDYTISNCEYE